MALFLSIAVINGWLHHRQRTLSVTIRPRGWPALSRLRTFFELTAPCASPSTERGPITGSRLAEQLIVLLPVYSSRSVAAAGRLA